MNKAYILVLIICLSAPLHGQEGWPLNPLLNGYKIEQFEVHGTKVLSLSPEKPKAMLVLLHGAGGLAEYWFHYSDQVRFILDMYKAGYIVASPESNDRENRRWSFKDRNNPDIRMLKELVKRISEKYVEDVPVFAAGMSNGGSFAPLAAYNLGFNAIAIYCSAGSEKYFTRKDFSVPVIMNIGKNESYFTEETAAARLELLNSRNIPYELNVKNPEPITLELFREIGGIADQDVERLYSVFTDNYFLDNRGYYSVSEFGMDWKRYIPEDLIHLEKEIWSLLWLGNAGHVFMDDYNEEVINFFSRFLQK